MYCAWAGWVVVEMNGCGSSKGCPVGMGRYRLLVRQGRVRYRRVQCDAVCVSLEGFKDAASAILGIPRGRRREWLLEDFIRRVIATAPSIRWTGSSRRCERENRGRGAHTAGTAGTAVGGETTWQVGTWERLRPAYGCDLKCLTARRGDQEGQAEDDATNTGIVGKGWE